MFSFLRVLNFVSEYKKNIIWYCLCIIGNVVFSLLSFGLFQPFLQIVFEDKVITQSTPANAGSLNLLNNFNAQVQHFIQQIIVTHNKEYALGMICIFILIGVFFRNVFIYFSLYFLAPIRHTISNKYAKMMYEKILELPISYFTQQKKGDIISRVSSDVMELEYAVIGILEGIFRDPITILGILFCLFALSVKLTLFILIFFPLSGYMVGIIGKSLRKNTTRAQEKWGSMLSHLEETISGLRIIKAFNAENVLTKLFNNLINDIFNIKNKIAKRRDLASPLSEFLGVSILCVVLWFGGRLVLKGEILSPSSFLTYIIYFSLMINPTKALTVSYNNMLKGKATLERINEIINYQIELKEIEKPIILKNLNKGIQFSNVYFNYGDKSVLNNINLTIEKGKSVALVGASGSGKSTLADLIPRFHDVLSGTILIDDMDIKKYAINSLRSQISIVTQEPILFNDTIFANIALGKPDASYEEVIEAAKIANAYHFIMQKEHNFYENIGDRGSKLSGGERQRITIARAVLKNPPILILDEATSALDTESERLVQEAINNMMENRTSLIIAHRLSTIRHCDTIVVLDKGIIVEQGNHQELLQKNGFYAKLLSLQDGGIIINE